MKMRVALARWLLRGTGFVPVATTEIRRVDALCGELEQCLLRAGRYQRLGVHQRRRQLARVTHEMVAVMDRLREGDARESQAP